MADSALTQLFPGSAHNGGGGGFSGAVAAPVSAASGAIASFGSAANHVSVLGLLAFDDIACRILVQAAARNMTRRAPS